MERLSTTPFGRRPVSAIHLAAIRAADTRTPTQKVDKWELFAKLRAAGDSFGVKYRTLAVLNALLSFLPGRTLDDRSALVVFPSNRTLSDRALGMPESTLRRHLTALLDAGLILRHDSPNGKRYAARNREGQVLHAFGFDLSPLLVRASEILAAARDAEDRAEQKRRLRERLTLLKRDSEKLLELVALDIPQVDYVELTAVLVDLQKRGRRKMRMSQLDSLVREAANLRHRIEGLRSCPTTEIAVNNDQNERHLQNSKKDTEESILDEIPQSQLSAEDEDTLPLASVIEICPEIRGYVTSWITSWSELLRLADSMYRFVGINPAAWINAKNYLGTKRASMVFCFILERLEEIHSPGAYLQSLIGRDASGKFSAIRMLKSLDKRARNLADVDSCQLRTTNGMTG